MSAGETSSRRFPAIGAIERLAPGLDALIPPGSRIEQLAEGFTWTEGRVWIADGEYLLFSDVPANRIHRWSEGDGAQLFLYPSGYDGPATDAFREPGSNGLIKSPGNTILMADHGNRAVARLDLVTREKTLLATRYQERRFNSPNDLVRAADGSIYFTDPPYGLTGLDASPLKELSFNGVFRLATDGRVTLVDDSLSFPNGILLSPDQRTLYVANSDPLRAIWMAYSLAGDGTITAKRIFADVTDRVGPAHPGLPDGMAIDACGNLFATGPGGVLIFTPGGDLLGIISTGTAIANCTFGEDGHTLFLASGPILARLRTRTRG